MNNVKVKYLKEKLQEAIEILNDLDEEENIATSTNTYGMTGWVLEIPNTGFVNIMDIKVEEDEDEDEDEEE